MEIAIEIIREQARQITAFLGLHASPVGVCIVAEPEPQDHSGMRLQQHRYCQALMKARHGEIVSLDASGIACPAAAAAFGFRPLPEGLKSGQGLVGFGIVSDPEVGRKMFENMPCLPQGEISHLELFPLEKASRIPDIIVVEDEVEKLMWLNLAYLNVTGGKRLTSSTAILQATCVDSTIIPYLENRLNFGFGCYGCREATDLSPNETVIGFPVGYLPGVVKALENLSHKAIPNSRAKKVYENILQRTQGTT